MLLTLVVTVEFAVRRRDFSSASRNKIYSLAEHDFSYIVCSAFVCKKSCQQDEMVALTLKKERACEDEVRN